MRNTTWIGVVAVALACGACGGDGGEPVLGAPEATTDEDTPVELDLLDGAVDPDGDALGLTSATAMGHKVDRLGGGRVRVTPALDFHGTLDVAYSVDDGAHLIAGRARITVRPVNDAPVAGDRTLAVKRTAMVELAGRDVDGDALTFEIVSGPAHGSLAGSAPALRYTAAAGFSGVDQLTYRALDGQLASAPATVRLDVSVNAPPVALADSISGFEDETQPVVLRATDADGDSLVFEIVTPPQLGTLTGTPPNLQYTPAKDRNGQDRLEFRVGDGDATSTATVTIGVLAVNDPPVAVAQSVAATEDAPASFQLDATDVDGDAVFIELLATPGRGTITSVDGTTVAYTPSPNANGLDTFTYRAHDGRASSAPVTVTIQVAAVADVPTALSFSRSIDEDIPRTFALLGSDADGDPLTYTITRQPAHGTVALSPPNVTYAPAPNFDGDDSFEYTVSDGSSTSASATVTLPIFAINDAPIASDAAVATQEDTPVTIALVATDVDSSSLTYTVVVSPQDGVLTGTGVSRTYTPAPNVSGTRTFEFQVSDGLRTDIGRVTIAIAAVDDPPATQDDYVATDPGTVLAIDVLRNDLDVEGTPVAIDSVAAPAHGDIEIVDGHLVYTPDAGFTGTDTFDYTARDGGGLTATARVHVGVPAFPAGAPLDSVAVAGLPINTTSSLRAPSLSSDGRYVAFATPSALDPADTNGLTDIYVFDRGPRTVRRVSIALDGGAPTSASTNARISADGRYIVYQSLASNIVAGDTNARLDVFRHDRITGQTVRISVSTAGAQGSSDSGAATISDDGNLIAFSSTSFELVADDTNGASDVFVRDVAAGTTTRVSVTTTGGGADLDSTQGAISGDGRCVAFSSAATNLVAGDTNGAGDVFVRDRVAGTTTRVSVASSGTEGNARSTRPSISRDGRFVAFISDATNLVPGSTAVASGYVRDTQSATTNPLSTASGLLDVKLAADGRYATGYTATGVFVRDRFAAQTHTPVVSTLLHWPALSPNGRYFAALHATGDGFVSVLPNPL